MMNWDYTMNGWMSGWMWIPIALLLTLLALGVAAMIRATATSTPHGVQPGLEVGVGAPFAIAARRLAQGEITKAQYDELRSTLAEVSPRP